MDYYRDAVRVGTGVSAFDPGASDWTRVGLAADFVNATVAFNDVTGWSVIIPANTVFTIEAELILLAGALATNSPRFGWTWNQAFSYAFAELEYDSAAGARTMLNLWNLTAAGVAQMAGGSAPVLNGAYGGYSLLKGKTAGAAVTVKGQLAAEADAANAAKLLVGSEFRWRTGP